MNPRCKSCGRDGEPEVCECGSMRCDQCQCGVACCWTAYHRQQEQRRIETSLWVSDGYLDSIGLAVARHAEAA